jgi:flavin-dependent dehydrogenase
MFDIAVIGAGPAGVVAALTAAQAGALVCLVNDRRLRKIDVGETLPSTAKPVLRSVGLLPLIVSKHPQFFGIKSVWSEAAVSEKNFVFDARGAGWRLDRAQFQEDAAMLLRSYGVAVWLDFELVNIEAIGNQWNLEIRSRKSQRRLRARGLIDATGRSSRVARTMGIKRLQEDRLVGVLLKQRCADLGEDTLTVEAASYGWWYSVRHKDDERLFGLMTDSDLLRRLGARSPAVWRDLLSKTTLLAKFAPAAEADSQRAPVVVPANGSRLARFSGRRWVAAGDAAIAFDPLSSQGVTTALMTGHRAALSLLEELDGKCCDHDQYARFVTRIFDDYLLQYGHHYRANERFSLDPFWRRRCS